jgi:hypothetical protein
MIGFGLLDLLILSASLCMSRALGGSRWAILNREHSSSAERDLSAALRAGESP